MLPPYKEWVACAYSKCKIKFPPRDKKIYCSKSHKKHAAAERKLQRELEEVKDNSGCATPNKMRFATEEAANLFTVRGKPKFQNKTAYLCPCGWWHNRTNRW